MRLAYYAGASTLAAGACLLKAFSQRPNFYSATVYLSQSNACLLILTNLLLLCSMTLLYLLQRLLYGPLRPIEIEQLSEKAWYAVLDTLLAMPSFREDVGAKLLGMFVLLLAGKVWGWIGEGRVDVLEQGQMTGNGANQKLFHARLATSLLVSVAFAVSMFVYCVDIVIEDPRPGMMVIFTFEFAILCVFSTFTLIRYGLAVWDIRVVKQQTAAAIEQRKDEIQAEREAAISLARQEEREVPTFDEPIEVAEEEVDVPGWEDKRRALFVVEVVTDFIKLLIYIFFFTVSVTFNGLPMHIMRDVYMTFASFSKRVSDYMAYRKATSDMNTRYPDATTEEIRGDSCIVCREEMLAWADGEPQAAAQPAADGQPAPAPAPALPASRRRDEGLRAKKLPCGHILHLRCLKAWLERQQVCPTCRRPVVTETAANGSAAAGGNAAAPGQNGAPGQAQPPRPRGRVFGFGPFRIGLVNAPRGQLQNVLNQIRNGDARGAQQAIDAVGNAAAGGAAQQPNAAGSTRIRGTIRSSVPTESYLLQLERRIMHDAHNLGIDHQQLATLRMMEAEFTRLQAQRLRHQVVTNQRYPMPGFAPQHQQPPSLSQAPQQLHGDRNQQMGSGHEHLPPGMVLPEGWTVMPLEPVGGQVQHGVRLPGPAPDSIVQVSPEGQEPVAGGVGTSVTDAAASNATSVSQRPSEDSRGPTDDNGSPLFIPTATQPSSERTAFPEGLLEAGPSMNHSEQLGSSASQQTIAAALRDAEARGEAAGQRLAEALGGSDEADLSTQTREATACPDVATQSQTKSPWTQAGWGFESNAQNTSQPTEETDSLANGRSIVPEGRTSETSQAGSSSGKGKGKAVEVEDVADPDA